MTVARNEQAVMILQSLQKISRTESGRCRDWMLTVEFGCRDVSGGMDGHNFGREFVHFSERTVLFVREGTRKGPQ